MIIQGDCLPHLRRMDENSVDLIVTDPPYGYSFMGKDWDKAVPSVEIWKECLRVLKPGGFAFIMSAPRSDVLSRMIVRVEDAGFRVDFSPIYWTYASGFPKAMNIGKMVDKRNGREVDPAVKNYLNERRTALGLSLNRINELLGTATNGGGVASAIMGDKTFNELPTVAIYNQLKSILELDNRFDELIEREEAEREVVSQRKVPAGHAFAGEHYGTEQGNKNFNDTLASTPEAKALDGSYGGFQPKPAVEVVIVAMKPLSEKTYVDQALKNGKGITWLDDCRVPTESALTYKSRLTHNENLNDDGWDKIGSDIKETTVTGRFPANLIVEDDILGDYSRFFSLDKWAENLPFLAVPKASKSEKNEGLDGFKKQEGKNPYAGGAGIGGRSQIDGEWVNTDRPRELKANHHPTVKPLTLMSYLITLGSREGDTVLDPFVGSGTTALAAEQLNRKAIGIEREQEYADIAQARVRNQQPRLVA